jgi:enoyl-CoA hydratase/carnithine racemase
VVPADELLDVAVALAARIAANPRPQLRLVKQLLTLNGSETDLEVVQTREDRWNRTYAVPSPEHREAVAAFAEKRAPNFTPRAPDLTD